MTSFLDNIPETESQTLKRLGHEIFTTTVFGERFCDDCGYAVQDEAYAIFVILENSYFFSDTERSDGEALDMLLDTSFSLACDIDEDEFSPDEIKRNFMDADSSQGFTSGFVGLVTELRKMLYGQKPNIELVRNFVINAIKPIQDDLFEQSLTAANQLISHSILSTEDLVNVLLGKYDPDKVGIDNASLVQLKFVHNEVLTNHNNAVTKIPEELAHLAAKEYLSDRGSETTKEKMLYELQLEHISYSQFAHVVMEAMKEIENVRSR